MEKDMTTAVVLWALAALCGVALAIFAADAVVHVLGILLGLAGVMGSIRAASRPDR